MSKISTHAITNTMRLSPDQQAAIRTTATAVFGERAEIWLFGSRANDSKHGGDIDLLIRPSPQASDKLFDRKIRFLVQLERQLGERKIDLVIETPNDTRPIVAIAHATGVPLK